MSIDSITKHSLDKSSFMENLSSQTGMYNYAMFRIQGSYTREKAFITNITRMLSYAMFSFK